MRSDPGMQPQMPEPPATRIMYSNRRRTNHTKGSKHALLHPSRTYAGIEDGEGDTGDSTRAVLKRMLPSDQADAQEVPREMAGCD